MTARDERAVADRAYSEETSMANLEEVFKGAQTLTVDDRVRLIRLLQAEIRGE